MPSRVAETFDYPVGPPGASGYYDAQDFGENDHLGEDWNADTGGNSDCGDDIFAIGNGVVSGVWRESSPETGGWGNAVAVRHLLPSGRVVESFYGHLKSVSVEAGDKVARGDRIAAMGDGDGGTSPGASGHCNGEPYFVHLHFEVRTVTGMGPGPGYSNDTSNYVDPSEFINRQGGSRAWSLDLPL